MTASNILLATTLKHDILSNLCIGNHTYVATYNNLTYHSKNLYSLQQLIETTHPSVICINHFSLFVTQHINAFTSLISDQIEIVFPVNIHSPLEMIPFMFKNSQWSKQFLTNYVQSKLYNCQSFIEKYGYQKCSRILYSDILHSHNSDFNQSHIIRQYTDIPIQQTLNYMTQINLNLGIII